MRANNETRKILHETRNETGLDYNLIFKLYQYAENMEEFKASVSKQKEIEIEKLEYRKLTGELSIAQSYTLKKIKGETFKEVPVYFGK